MAQGWETGWDEEMALETVPMMVKDLVLEWEAE